MRHRLAGAVDPLVVQGLSVRYAAQRALVEVSLALRRDQRCLGIIGPNGAGKSTLLRCISGGVEPEAGTVELWGRPLAGLTPWEIRKSGVCLVPEGRGVFPGMTVSENLTLFGADRDSAYETFPALRERQNQIAGSLSGGEQQMLALAAVNTADCRLVLFDELSLGLSPLMVKAVYDVVRAMRDKDIRIVIVEQYVNSVLSIADEVCVLRKGRVVYLGDGERLHDQRFLRGIYFGD